MSEAGGSYEAPIAAELGALPLCKHCGGEPLVCSTAGIVFWVECVECGMRTSNQGLTRAEAMARWRASAPGTPV